MDLTKDDRRRRYWIRPSARRDVWYAQVFYGPDQHRGTTGSFAQAERCYAEFTREIADALRDGWILAHA